MSKRNKILLIVFLAIDILLVFFALLQINGFFTHFGTFAVLQPRGIVARGERNLIVTAVLLMLCIVVPVWIFAVYVAKTFDAHKGAEYAPEWDSNSKLQFLWWLFPSAIIFGIALLTWNGAHKLDPYRPIDSNVRPITIQVVALNWKWLFIYPEQNIATVNFIEIPQKTPVNFILTADGPMNSFWIPQLAGQIYAMAGMSTQLNVMADEVGLYKGSAAEINGKGFSGMNFTVQSTTEKDFSTWVQSVSEKGNPLTEEEYKKLSEPSTDNTEILYGSVEGDLFNHIIAQYMSTSSTHHE